MDNLLHEFASLNRIAQPEEFLSGSNSEYRFPHAAVSAQVLAGQHAIRAWEYSQALRALEFWRITQTDTADSLAILEVGGAGSEFWRTLLPHSLYRIDPAFPPQTLGCAPDVENVLLFPHTLAEWRARHPHEYDVVCCLSVIEHVKDPQRFLDQLCDAVRPGGLLLLSFDAAEQDGPDTYHFHWMREWIARPFEQVGIVRQLAQRQFSPLTPVDFCYTGPTVYDYSVMSLALMRKG